MSEKAERAGEPSNYQSYLLRVWQVDDGHESWRASLESAGTVGRKGFANLEELFGFLRRQTDARPDGHLAGNQDERGVEEEEGRWSSGSTDQHSPQRKYHRLSKIYEFLKERTQ